MTDFREEAEKHWQFLEILLINPDTATTSIPLERVKYLYIEAMVHGYKHAVKELTP